MCAKSIDHTRSLDYAQDDESVILTEVEESRWISRFHFVSLEMTLDVIPTEVEESKFGHKDLDKWNLLH